MRSSLASTSPVDPATGLSAFVLDRLTDLVRRVPAVERAALYGSRARGDHRSHSDIDIAVYGARVTDSDIATLRRFHDESVIVFPVDFTAVDRIAATHPLRGDIARDAIVFFERDLG